MFVHSLKLKFSVPVTSSQIDDTETWGRRNPGRKVTLLHLLKVICASRESCLNWLKNRGLVPKVVFCPKCKKKMKAEIKEEAIDGYVWICKVNLHVL